MNSWVRQFICLLNGIMWYATLHNVQHNKMSIPKSWILYLWHLVVANPHHASLNNALSANWELLCAIHWGVEFAYNLRSEWWVIQWQIWFISTKNEWIIAPRNRGHRQTCHQTVFTHMHKVMCIKTNECVPLSWSRHYRITLSLYIYIYLILINTQVHAISVHSNLLVFIASCIICTP